MIAILYPLKMDKNLSEAYSSIYKEGTKYGLYKGDGKSKGAAKKYLDNKAKQLQKEYDKQSDAEKNNPAFQPNRLNPKPQYNSYEPQGELVSERRGSSSEQLKKNRDKAFTSKKTDKADKSFTPKKPLKDTGNPFQNAWQKFVPPRESSNNENVRSGKRQPGKLEAGALKSMNDTMKKANKPIKAVSQTYKKGKKVISTAIQKVDKLNKMADKLPGQVKTGAKIALGAGAAVLGAKALMDRRKKKKEEKKNQQNEGRFRAEWEAFKLIEKEDYIERFENWKNGLVEEGYDVSRWTKEDLVETFISENDLFSSQESIIDALFEAKDKKGKGSGKKDACYHKVKSRYDVWPSAYASGALVKCRKVGAKNWGNSSKKEDFSDWRSDLGLLDENKDMSDKFYAIAKKKGEQRRSSREYRKGGRRGVEKNERAAYNLSQASVSRNKSLETQGGPQTGGGSKPFGYASDKKNPVKSKSVGDTGAEGHRKNRDEKITTKKDGKTPLKTPRYKLSMGQRVDHHSSRRQELKDPKKNPKHEANKK